MTRFPSISSSQSSSPITSSSKHPVTPLLYRSITMKVTATTSAAIMALTSSTLVNAKAWTMHIYNDGGDWQGVPIVAWNGQFVAALGEFDTTATCQPEVWNCTGKNTTMIPGLDEAGTANDLWMAITQAGGQKVYWHDAPQGHQHSRILVPTQLHSRELQRRRQRHQDRCRGPEIRRLECYHWRLQP